MKTILTARCQTPEDTSKLAHQLAGLFRINDVVLLQGNLGAGKTFLVKEICKIWDTDDEASSPSFTIMNYYGGFQPVNHLDFYRIGDVRELDNLGWEETLDNGSVTFIEWPEIIESQLQRFYKISIEFDGEDRVIALTRTDRANGRGR
jgi:tRNA threonylcarbamoyladenosine biosynthesis protein TsaE